MVVITRILGQVADLLADGHAVAHAILAEDRRATAAGFSQPEQQFDRGALAGAVRPQKAKDRVAGDMQIERLERIDALVGFAQAVRADHQVIGCLHCFVLLGYSLICLIVISPARLLTVRSTRLAAVSKSGDT